MKYIKKFLPVLFLLLGILLGKWIFSGHPSGETRPSGTPAVETGVEHWTCSMHPQIDLPHPGKCPICGMDLIPKTESKEKLSPGEIRMTDRAIALAGVETMKVGEAQGGEETGQIILPGKIAVNKENEAIQAAHFGGRIEKLFFQTPGERIRKGDLIALVYSPELVTAQHELLEAYYIRKEQPELYQSVRNKLINWKIPPKMIDKIEHTKKVITRFPMYADKSGYIDQILVETGNHVKEGTPMYKLAGLETVWAVFDAYEKDIPHLKKGMPVEIRLNAYPGQSVRARIDFVSPELDPQTRTVEVRATLSNKKNFYKPGMILTGIIRTAGGSGKYLHVPKTAVLWTGKRSVVYVRTRPGEPVFEWREVELGKETGDSYEILSGLRPGEEIVVKGTFMIDAAAQLQGKKSMMNAKTDTATTHAKKPGGMKCGAGKCGSGM